MLAVIILAVVAGQPSELACLEFGKPIDPPVDVETHVRAVLADWDRRHLELWEVPLGESGPVLIRVAREATNDPPLCATALAGLGLLGMPRGSVTVASFLNHADERILVAAIRGAGQLRLADQRPQLEAYLAHRRPQVRRAAIGALGKLGDEGVIPRLEEAARRDQSLSSTVQQAKLVCSAIASGDPARIVSTLIDSDDWEDLLPLMTHFWQQVAIIGGDSQRTLTTRVRALRLLRVAGIRDAAGLMQAVLISEREPAELKVEAALAAGRCGIRKAFEPLIALLRSPDPALQTAAVTSLGQLSDLRAFRPLVNVWDAQGGVVRPQVRLAMRRLCGKHGSEQLIQHLREGGSLSGESVLVVDDDLKLFRTSPPGMAAQLLMSPSAEARRDAAILLGLIGSGQDRQKLAPLVNDGDLEVRVAAEAARHRLEGVP